VSAAPVLVTTVGERCRTCYTCVRECPAKAIRIADRQAQVIPERCIGCGNCVRVCSQGAKVVVSSLDEARALLDSPRRVAAAVAPSFPAEFPDLDEGAFVGLLRAAGFDLVHEVGYGADLVAVRTREILARDDGRRWIATACPAIVSFVERYHPDQCGALLPVVSPMTASAKALRRLHGDDLAVIFLGPCLAKKGEAAATSGDGRVEAALTFRELRVLLAERVPAGAPAAADAFDPPLAGAGAIFPLTRGLVQTAGMDEDLITGLVVSADGRQDFPQALREFAAGDLDARLLDVLCCNGCVMGVGMTTAEPVFRRRARVSRHAARRRAAAAAAAPPALPDLDLGRTFAPDDHLLRRPGSAEIEAILRRLGKRTPADELDCRACGYETCRQHAEAIAMGMAESEMCLPYVIDELRHTVDELHESHAELASTQELLMHTERLASMGQLAAGIAHEVNNPLGVVLLYAHMLQDELRERGEAGGMTADLDLIVQQADRCRTIVSGLLNFARQNKVVARELRVADLVASALAGIVVPAEARLDVRHAAPDLPVRVDPDQFGQVVANLVGNALDATGGRGPIRVATSPRDGGGFRLDVSDDGCGIPRENLGKVFEPFFTTKPRGVGTGLGLAVLYGIVKMHRGDISVASNADPAAGATGTTFTILLPDAESACGEPGGPQP